MLLFWKKFPKTGQNGLPALQSEKKSVPLGAVRPAERGLGGHDWPQISHTKKTKNLIYNNIIINNQTIFQL